MGSSTFLERIEGESDFDRAVLRLWEAGRPTDEEVAEEGRRILDSFWPGTYIRGRAVEQTRTMPMPAEVAERWALIELIERRNRWNASGPVGAVPLCDPAAWAYEDRDVAVTVPERDVQALFRRNLDDVLAVVQREANASWPTGSLVLAVREGPVAVRVKAPVQVWTEPDVRPPVVGWLFYGWA